MCEVKKDCFGFEQTQNTCRVLKGLFCKHEQCGIYKTKEQLEKERKLYGGVKR